MGGTLYDFALQLGRARSQPEGRCTVGSGYLDPIWSNPWMSLSIILSYPCSRKK